MRIVFCLLVLISCAVNATDGIPAMYRMVAAESQVPAKLFYALILNESKSQTSSGNTVRPWPWTINHRGTPHYFQSRQDAYEFAVSLVDMGDNSFDVGLGQMNWRWHSQRFNSLWEALDPYTNLSSSAAFLREQYERPQCGSWEKAVGCYHRPGQREIDLRISQKYTKRVISIWKTI